MATSSPAMSSFPPKLLNPKSPISDSGISRSFSSKILCQVPKITFLPQIIFALCISLANGSQIWLNWKKPLLIDEFLLP
jgi:hypothetical protein